MSKVHSQKGFSLVELLITMTIMLLVITSASNIFVTLLAQFKQNTKIAETNIEGYVGIGILKKDLSNAGFGLGFTGYSSATYAEAVSPANIYNDAPNGVPRPVISGDNAGINGSDYLVIKSTTVSSDKECRKTTFLNVSGTVKKWSLEIDNMADNTRVIVITPDRDESTSTNGRWLVSNGGVFYTTFDKPNNKIADPLFYPDLGAYFVYAVDATKNLRMPFNRADYYISKSNVPAQCAPNTGVLLKAIVSHTSGNFDYDPILDCVADMQISYRIDMNNDGSADTTCNADGSVFTSTETVSGVEVSNIFKSAKSIREKIKEIHIYILTHEGQVDSNYTYNRTNIYVGDTGVGHNFSIGSNIHYRWKVYHVMSRPYNMR